MSKKKKAARKPARSKHAAAEAAPMVSADLVLSMVDAIDTVGPRDAVASFRTLACYRDATPEFRGVLLWHLAAAFRVWMDQTVSGFCDSLRRAA